MGVVRVRFAPSPTGYLHIGGARTAIFNWLLARKLGGRFLLRIEDTDTKRSKKEYEDDILDAIRWLGLDWDEEPLRQSSRKTFHVEMAEELIDRGAAYRCFLPPEETQKMKEDSKTHGDGRAFRSPFRGLSKEESDKKAEAGEPFVVRFKIPDEPVVYVDGVHGKVSIQPETIEDFIILRTDGTPTYQVAVVADDMEMGITHVIRGDDHISNTPKQILIYKALGWKVPEFSHVPLILGTDKKRLSKRHGATAVTEYRENGYLPQAIVCFLALLGWSPGDDREIMKLDELIEAFGTEGINKKSAVFDEKKLEWMNGEFLSLMDDKDIEMLLRPLFAQKVISGELPKGAGLHLGTAVRLLKSRARFPMDIIERGDFFFKDPETIDSKAAKKRLKDEELPVWLDELANRMEKLDQWTEANTDEVLRIYSEELDVNSGKLIHPTRLATSGQAGGPGLFEMLEALGQETVVRRLRWLAELLREKGIPPNLDD